MRQSFEKSVSTDGVAYFRSGSGPPIVFVHGVGLCAEAWLFQVESILPTHTVIAVDIPGHGKSVPFEHSNPQLVDYSERIMSCLLEIDLFPVAIAGHSMGAMIALDLGIRYPDRFTAVIALNAIFGRTDAARSAVRQRAAALQGDATADSVSGPIDRWFRQSRGGKNSHAASLCERWLRDVDKQGYADAYRVFAHCDGPEAAALSAMDVPALFLTGACDPNSTPEMSNSMAQIAPHGEAIVIPDAAHMLPLTHASDVSNAVMRFADSCATGQSRT